MSEYSLFRFPRISSIPILLLSERIILMRSAGSCQLDGLEARGAPDAKTSANNLTLQFGAGSIPP